MLNIKIILGSTRQGRTSEKVLPWIQNVLADEEGMVFEALDLRDYPMPFYDEPVSPSQVADGKYPNDVVRTWAKKIDEADAFLIITPEYNHAPPAVLKNALDSVYAEWNNKAVGFVSYGSVGGARAVEQLRPVATELQMMPVRVALHIPAPWNLMDESGSFKTGALDPYASALKNLATQLRWWGNALKTAREK
ncbi:MAG: hypothetical protein B7X04_00115 [Parcubacteria group bacterium 21-54-25]|nr:MAG: hypothetical protein B7X04_00115 [Parcubacteria group bacterium 21-54-25]HQU07537.1 NAD(P)H-dependent oxidoreductase [Candidatus Paceibacterota bacterium]